MKLFDFTYYAPAITSTDAYQSALNQLVTYNEIMQQNATDKTSPLYFLHAPGDEQSYEDIKKCADEKKQLNPSLIVVVGIGGSHLGAAACYQACFEKASPNIPELVFVDTIDPDFFYAVYAQIQALLESGKPILLIIVTKSGTTLETIVNAELLIALLKKHYADTYNQYIVVITEPHCALWQQAQQKNIRCLESIPAIAGRFSVFTAAGWFPLLMVGIDVSALRDGAKQITNAYMKDNFATNASAIMANLLYQGYRQGITIHDTFLFATRFEYLGKWYRQLLAESIGKERTTQGNVVHVGITPTVSLGTSDLHSVAQLYFGGSQNRFITFVSTNYHDAYETLCNKEFSLLPAAISSFTMPELFHVVRDSVVLAYQEINRPYASIILPDRSVVYVGQFMQYAMMQVCYLGFLFEVNTFDQPEVERYKTYVKKLVNGTQ